VDRTAASRPTVPGSRTPLPRYRLVRPPAPEVASPVLDVGQLQVVAHRSGPLLVIGGPGTG
jgi:hypothetical protein